MGFPPIPSMHHVVLSRAGLSSEAEDKANAKSFVQFCPEVETFRPGRQGPRALAGRPFSMTRTVTRHNVSFPSPNSQHPALSTGLALRRQPLFVPQSPLAVRLSWGVLQGRETHRSARRELRPWKRWSLRGSGSGSLSLERPRDVGRLLRLLSLWAQCSPRERNPIQGLTTGLLPLSPSPGGSFLSLTLPPPPPLLPPLVSYSGIFKKVFFI